MQPNYSETRERLASLLWGEVPDRQARQSLRQALVSLRADLTPFGAKLLLIERETIRLEPTTVTVDARQLLSLAESNKPEDIDSASKLLEGPFLDGVDLPAEGFSEWLQQQRVRMEAAAGTVLARAAEQADAAGKGARAVHFAERLLALDPTQDSSHRLLLRVLARDRGPDEALARADRLATKLREDLHVGLNSETRALLAEIHARKVEPIARTESRQAYEAYDHDPGQRANPDAVSTVNPPAGEKVAATIPRSRLPLFVSGLATLGLIAAIVGLFVFGQSLTAFIDGSRRSSNDVSVTQIKLVPGVTAATANLSGLNPIMVLPFSSDANSTEDAGAAQALTDNLIHDLSLVTSLRIISRSTSQLYKDKKFDIASVGTELGVRYVVEGSVHTNGGAARIDASLTDTSTRLSIWSQRFERPASELPSVKSDITRGIARQLQVSIYLAEEARLTPKPSGDPTLEDLLTRGWAALMRSPGDGPAQNPGSFFAEALKLAPNNKSAQLGYAGSQIVPATSQLGKSAEYDLDRAEQILKHLLEDDPRDGTALLYSGMLRRLRGDLAGARDDFLRSIEYHPSFAVAYAQAGYTFYRLGDYDRGLEFVLYAMRLSPRDPGLGVWSYMAGMIELERSNDAAALDWLDRSVALVPRSIFARLALAAVFTQRTDIAAAQGQLQELAHIAPWLTLSTVRTQLGLYDQPSGTRRRLLEGIEKAFKRAG